MKRFEATPEVQRLVEYLQGVKPGDYLSYERIEVDTGIRMDTVGRARLRSACRSLKLNYRADPKHGIELEAPGNALAIVGVKANRVRNAIKSARRTGEKLFERHGSAMNDGDRERLGLFVSVMGAVEATARAFSPFRKASIKAPAVEQGVKVPRVRWK